jgi:two-component system sensor histidine kinase YesM
MSKIINYIYDYISFIFNHMADNIQALIKDMRLIQGEQLALEMRALQAQLSPHMIFNSISAIRWMAKATGADRVSDMLVALAGVLYPVFKEWKPAWTLKEELEHLNQYLKMLYLRFAQAS